MIKHILTALFHWTLLLALRIPMILLGFVAVAIALHWRTIDYASAEPFGRWTLVSLPRWAWPWDNLRDGAMGDKRLNYWDTEAPRFLKENAWWKMWWWLCIRNPVNNFSRFTRGIACKVDQCHVSLLAGRLFVSDTSGDAGWQFVVANGPIYNYYGFYWVSPRFTLFGKRRVASIRLGHKVEPRHNSTDFSQDPQKAWKGITFRTGIYS